MSGTVAAVSVALGDGELPESSEQAANTGSSAPSSQMRNIHKRRALQATLMVITRSPAAGAFKQSAPTSKLATSW